MDDAHGQSVITIDETYCQKVTILSRRVKDMFPRSSKLGASQKSLSARYLRGGN